MRRARARSGLRKLAFRINMYRIYPVVESRESVRSMIRMYMYIRDLYIRIYILGYIYIYIKNAPRISTRSTPSFSSFVMQRTVHYENNSRGSHTHSPLNTPENKCISCLAREKNEKGKRAKRDRQIYVISPDRDRRTMKLRRT